MATKKSCRIYIQCNPLLDITVAVEKSFFSKYDLDEDCAYLYSSHYRAAFEDIMARELPMRSSPGGAGLNAARVAQWVLSHVLDEEGQVMYVGCVGHDKYGKQIDDVASADGVRMQLEVHESVPSGICLVFTSGKSRTLLAKPSSANLLSNKFMETPEVQKGLDEVDIVYTTAYATSSRSSQALALAQRTRANTRANAAKQLFALGLSNKKVLEEFGEDLIDILSQVDLVIGNLEEARDLAMMLLWLPDEMSDMELVKKLATEMMYDGHARRCVIITRGAEPILYATSSGECGEVAVVPVSGGAVKVNSSGIGDAFIGGALGALVSRPDDMAYCCGVGARAAAFAIQHSILKLPVEGSSLEEMRAKP